MKKNKKSKWSKIKQLPSPIITIEIIGAGGGGGVVGSKKRLAKLAFREKDLLGAKITVGNK